MLVHSNLGERDGRSDFVAEDRKGRQFETSGSEDLLSAQQLKRVASTDVTQSWECTGVRACIRNQ